MCTDIKVKKSTVGNTHTHTLIEAIKLFFLVCLPGCDTEKTVPSGLESNVSCIDTVMFVYLQ